MLKFLVLVIVPCLLYKIISLFSGSTQVFEIKEHELYNFQLIQIKIIKMILQVLQNVNIKSEFKVYGISHIPKYRISRPESGYIRVRLKHLILIENKEVFKIFKKMVHTLKDTKARLKWLLLVLTNVGLIWRPNNEEQ